MFKYLILLLITACGFQPIYGQKYVLDTANHLAAVQLEPINEEFGNKLHLILKQALNPTRISSPIQYKLHVTLTHSLAPFAIVANSQILKYLLISNASFKLLDSKTNTELLNGVISVSGSYYATSSEFDTFTTEQKAFDNNFKQIGEDLRNKLVVFFTYNQNSKISKNQ